MKFKVVLVYDIVIELEVEFRVIADGGVSVW